MGIASSMDDKYWMQLAYQQALLAKSAGEVPIGAVIVDANQQLIATGFNQVITPHDPCGHAEILAIRRACEHQHNYRLNDATMYVTLEPCVMCAGAIVHARLARIVFATRDLNAGAAGSVYNLLRGYPLNHRVQIDEGIMQQESATLLHDFFEERRKA